MKYQRFKEYRQMKLFPSVLIFLAASVAATAMPVSPCASGVSVAQYEASSPCSINQVQFSGFFEGGANPATTFIVVMSQPNDEGFTFSVAGGQTAPLLIFYTATCLTTFPCITGVSDSTSEDRAGAGSYLFTAAVDDGIHTSTSINWNQNFQASSSGLFSMAFFGGSDNQSSTLDIRTASSVPEPMHWPVLALSIIIISFVARRRKA